LRNFGHSAAVRIEPYFWLVYMRPGTNEDFTKPFDYQREMWREQSSAEELYNPYLASALFPGDEPRSIQFSVRGRAINEGEFYPADGTPDDVAPVLVGCIDYQFVFPAEHHQTGFAYDICRYDSRQPHVCPAIRVGKEVPLSALKIVERSDGTYVN